MGSVWRANDEVLDRPVAIKVLAAQLSDDPEFRQRFRREARAAARLDHPSITQVYDYGEIEQPGGVLQFLVMELLPGRTLADRLERGSLSVADAAGIGAQVADALDSAHRSGVVHRDITPGNIMLTPAGVKVLDFGISTVVGDSSMTAAGQTLGTPAYLAPERVQGLPATSAVDVYALAAVLFYAVTGRTPYQGSWTEQAHAHLHQPAPDPGEIPGPLGHVLHACLAKQPTDRPTAAQLAGGLRGVAGAAQAGPPIPVVPAPIPRVVHHQGGSTQVLPAADRRPASPSRAGTVALIAFVIFLVGAVATLASYLLLSDDPEGGQTSSPPTATATPEPSPTPSEPEPDPDFGDLSADEAFGRITDLITDATVSGDITPRVAVDVGRTMGRVVQRVAEQEYREADHQLEDLVRRVEDRFEAGDVDAEVYFELTGLLNRLLTLVPDENPDRDGGND